jgi:hypothetical protein
MVMPTRTTTSTGTAEAIHPALVDLLRTLAPTADLATIRSTLHTLASTAKAALTRGASAIDLLDAVITDTAPPPPGPPQPWERYLDLSLDAFRASGVCLIVRVPALDITHYLVGNEADRVPLAERERLFHYQVKTPEIVAEVSGLTLADSSTLGSLIEALGGRLTGAIPTVGR